VYFFYLNYALLTHFAARCNLSPVTTYNLSDCHLLAMPLVCVMFSICLRITITSASQALMETKYESLLGLGHAIFLYKEDEKRFKNICLV